ncbi:MAG: homoserine kinase [marine bacterium B5-7]|nr:MAG: homoserine kinase [marine bacterium B5-7]
MSVYTNVLPHELDEFLENYSLGQLQQFAGISDGIENTNYFVTTSKGQYVLTLFEELSLQELPYFLELMAFLAEASVPTAHPVKDKEGSYLRVLNGKPAALVKRLNGASIDIPNEKQCRAIGVHMARMHVASNGFNLERQASRGIEWQMQTAERVMPKLNQEEQALLQQELVYHDGIDLDILPVSVIHADLFRDNALFIGDELTGMIDFYYAYNGLSIYDLAVTINDWCMNGDAERNKHNSVALLQAYQTVRPIGQRERDAWQAVLRSAALRFWLSRLQDKYFPRDGEMTHIKDPDVFKRIVEHRAHHPDELAEMWV